MRKPRLTAAVVRGLRECRSLISMELESGDRGAFDTSNGGKGATDPARGLAYIDALIDWHEEKAKR